jgi:chorismate mutase
MDIGDWRKKIDEVDAAVLKLLNLRADMAIQIGKLKAVEGIGLRTPTREREIVERMQAANPGPLDAEAIEGIYETIVNQCIRAQERSRGGSSEQAARDAAQQSPAAGKWATTGKTIPTAQKLTKASKTRKGRKAAK